jgi:hypothetical protein
MKLEIGSPNSVLERYHLHTGCEVLGEVVDYLGMRELIEEPSPDLDRKLIQEALGILNNFHLMMIISHGPGFGWEEA